MIENAYVAVIYVVLNDFQEIAYIFREIYCQWGNHLFLFFSNHPLGLHMYPR